jgi:8-oxo-dGTP pyrophosphatase MutT (NUDIX family)
MTDLTVRPPTKWAVGTRRLFSSPWMEVREDDVRAADGAADGFAVVTRADFTVVVCLTGGLLIMTEQYRYAAARWSLELPQGGILPGESAEDAALRELREETGWHAARPTVLAAPLYEAADWATQQFTVVEADALDRSEPELDRTEHGAVTRLVAPADITELIRRRHICDAATLAALAVWTRLGGRRPRTSKDEGEISCEY